MTTRSIIRRNPKRRKDQKTKKKTSETNLEREREASTYGSLLEYSLTHLPHLNTYFFFFFGFLSCFREGISVFFLSLIFVLSK